MNPPSQARREITDFARSSLIWTDLPFWEPQMCNCHAAIKSSKISISNVNFHPYPLPSKGDVCQGKKSYFPTLCSETKAAYKFNIKVRSSYFNLNFRRRETEAPKVLSWGEEDSRVHGGFSPRRGETKDPAVQSLQLWETHGTGHWVVRVLQFVPERDHQHPRCCFKRCQLMAINETVPNSPSVTQFL